MTYVLKTPSLQHLAQVKIVSDVWNRQGIRSEIAKAIKRQTPFEAGGEFEAKEWEKVEEKVKEKISTLPLPPLDKDVLIHFIKPLGHELLNWYMCHYDRTLELVYVRKVPKQLCWTMRGTVDFKKTAEEIIKDEMLDDADRFKLACVNCLEKDISNLYKLLNEYQKREFIENVSGFWRTDMQNLIIFWIYFMSSELELQTFVRSKSWPACTPYQFAFNCATRGGNRAACVHLFKKLSQKERIRILSEFRRLSENKNIVVFQMLSELRERQQDQFLQQSFVNLLVCLLCWPYQALFLETTKRGWHFLTKDDCRNVLSVIAIKIHSGFTDYNYVQLFVELWQLSSAEYRKCFMNDGMSIVELFRTKQVPMIQLIVNEITTGQIQRLVDFRKRGLMEMITEDSIVFDEPSNEWKVNIQFADS